MASFFILCTSGLEIEFHKKAHGVPTLSSKFKDVTSTFQAQCPQIQGPNTTKLEQQEESSAQLSGNTNKVTQQA